MRRVATQAVAMYSALVVNNSLTSPIIFVQRRTGASCWLAVVTSGVGCISSASFRSVFSTFFVFDLGHGVVILMILQHHVPLRYIPRNTLLPRFIVAC